MQGDRIWKGMALALAVGALATSLNAGLSAARHREILAGKEADLRKIQVYAGRWAQEDALRAALEERQAWTPADLDELATRALGAGAAKISPRAARNAAPSAALWPELRWRRNTRNSGMSACSSPKRWPVASVEPSSTTTISNGRPSPRSTSATSRITCAMQASSL